MKDNKQNKGISLIVLIITIAVVIILAAAVILSMNNNRPIESAKTATEKNDIAVLKESAGVLSAQWEVDKLLDESIGTRTEYVQSGLSRQGFEQSMINKVSVDEKTGKVILSSVEVYDANNPTIPNGFEHVEGTEVATGYVIRNSTDSNEFVWVPVEDIADFVREDSPGSIENPVSSGLTTEPLNYDGAMAGSSEVDEYNAMKASVEKYKGFYIGRYEASNDGRGNAQSKANQTPWEMSFANSMIDLRGGAVEKARAVYSVSNAKNEKDPVSTLVYGVQWDVTAKWLEKNYPGIIADSTGYGNFMSGGSDRILTGSNENYKLNNIYDMGGNAPEWTMEAYEASNRIMRGDNISSNWGKSISFRSIITSATIHNWETGFRLALYIK